MIKAKGNFLVHTALAVCTCALLVMSVVVGMYNNPNTALAEPSSTSTEMTQAAKNAVAAKELAQQVADLQNKYHGLEASSSDFQPTVDSLSKCFGDQDQSQRVPWYSENGTWIVAGVAQSSTGDILVEWRCDASSEADAPVYAFAHATYSNGKFVRGSHVTTQNGNAAVSPTGGTPQSTGEHISNLVEQIKKVAGDAPAPMADSDYADIAKARQQLKESQGGTN